MGEVSVGWMVTAIVEFFLVLYFIARSYKWEEDARLSRMQLMAVRPTEEEG